MRHESRKGGEGQDAGHTLKSLDQGWYLGASFLGRAEAEHWGFTIDGLSL